MYGEGFYDFKLELPRLSRTVDILPATVSERLIVDMDLSVGTYVKYMANYVHYNRYIDGSSKLILTIFTRDIRVLEDDKEIKGVIKIT